MRLRKYQCSTIDTILKRFKTRHGTGLWLGCGLGKTATVLHAIDTLRDWYGIKRSVIVAPAKVIATSWPKEIRNWGLDLSYDILTSQNWDEVKKRNSDILFIGSENLAERVLSDDARTKSVKTALMNIEGVGAKSAKRIMADCGIVGNTKINLLTEVQRLSIIDTLRFEFPQSAISEFESASFVGPQLAERLKKVKFNLGADLVVFDEVTKFKTWSASRTKQARKLSIQAKHRITMTGSPTPNCLGEVFSQHFLLDLGLTLSPHIGYFRDKYMKSCGFEGREWEMRPEMVQPLLDTLKPWYVCQEAIDHLEMPDLITNIVEVELPPAAMAKYKGMEKQMYAELESGDTVTALSGGSRYNYCRQMASGCVYNDDDGRSVIHTAKVDKLLDIIEEMQGKPLLVAYWYHHEGELLKSKIKDAVIVNGSTSVSDLVRIIDKWQRGEIPVMLAQSSSISHGVDGLQKGCNDICWFTLSDNPDVVHQFLHRVYRQGNNGNRVCVHYLIATGTIDRKVLKAIQEKAKNQQEVLSYVKCP